MSVLRIKFLKSSIALLLGFSAGIGLISYTTSCSGNLPTPTPPTPQEKPIPFTEKYFSLTITNNQLNVNGMQSSADTSNYNTLSIPPTYTDENNNTYRVASIGVDAFLREFSFDTRSNIINLDLTNASNLRTIYSGAFSLCKAFCNTLTIPGSVTSIGANAFANTCFTNIVNHSSNFNFADNVGSARVLINATSGTSLNYDGGSIVGCIAFGKLTIPSSVTTIGDELFNSCLELTDSLTIPNSVITVGDYAFSSCSGFNGALTIGNSVTRIEYYAFYNCSGFTGSLTIPNSVTSINNYAFYNCSAFNGTLTINDSVINIGGNAFSGCSKFNTIDVSN
jgi:hypothetical protein